MKTAQRIAVFSTLGLLVACGGGSSGDSVSDSADNTVSGSVGDGPVVNASIVATDATGAVIAETFSDSRANYSIALPPDAAYPVTIEARGGTDVVTGREPDFAMVTTVLDAGTQTANINPFSTLITKSAESMDGGLNAANVGTAKQYVFNSFSFGLDANVVADPIGADVDTNNVAAMVKSSEALGETIRRTRGTLLSTGFTFSHDDVVDSIASDLTDGVVDGRGASANARISATATVATAQVLTETVTNRLRVDGADATASMDSAIRLTEPDATATVNDVALSAAVIEQTKTAVNGAQLVTGSAEVDALAADLDQLQEGMRPSDAAEIVDNNDIASLDPALTRMVTATHEELDAINMLAAGSASQDAAVDLGIFVSTSAQRTGATDVDGASVSGGIYVFASEDPAIRNVAFFIDDPDMTAQPLVVETRAPYDLGGTAGDGGSNAYDTLALAGGPHVLTARFTMDNGDIHVVHGNFTVNNATGEMPATTDPVDAADPVDSSNPANTTDPVDTTDPVGATDPVDTTDPVGATDPVDTSDPAGTTDPVDSTDPAGTTDPVDSTDPAGTTDPVDTPDPVDSTSPVTDVTPTASRDSAVTSVDTPIDIDVLANDNGLDNAPISVAVTGAPSNGTAAVTSGQSVLYTPALGFSGADGFTYKVTDADGDVSMASVSISVECGADCGGDKTVRLSWSPNPDNVLGYVVYRGATITEATEVAADIPVDAGQFDPLAPSTEFAANADLGLQPGDRVCFRVKAYNSLGFSDYSQGVCGDI